MSKISITYPESWLNPTISVVNTTTNIEDFSGVMSEVWTTKVYIYEFTEVVNTDYVYVIKTAGYNDISDSIFYETSSGWLTIEEHNKLMNLIGGWFAWWDFTASDRKLIKDTHEKVIQLENTDITNLESKISEIDSHITFAFDDTINTIKESEIEVCSDIVRSKKELKEDNLTTRQLVRGKAKKLEENTQKLADRQDKIDNMIKNEADEIESEIEKILNEEADMIENEIYNKEADEIEKDITNQSNDGNSESNS